MLDPSWLHDIVPAAELGSDALSLLKLIWRPASPRHSPKRRCKRQNQRNASARDRNGQAKDEGEGHVRFVGRVQTEGNWDSTGLGNSKGVITLPKAMVRLAGTVRNNGCGRYETGRQPRLSEK